MALGPWLRLFAGDRCVGGTLLERGLAFHRTQVGEGCEGPCRNGFESDRTAHQFPNRSPLVSLESGSSPDVLKAPQRLLRIFFIAEARYGGEIEGGHHWSGKTVWSGDITKHREELLGNLDLPNGTGPTKWWLTEFEDR